MIDWYYDKLPGSTFASELHQLRSRGDVVRASALGGAMPIYYILGHQALAEAFRDGEQFPPGHAYQIISLPFIGETFMSMNEDQHRVWRVPMSHSFRRHVIDQMDQHQLARIGHDILDLLDGKTAADWVKSFTRRYAFRVICHQLGLPIEQEDCYYQWSMDPMFGGRDLQKSRVADEKFTAMVRPVINARREEPRDDQISRWLNTAVAGHEINRPHAPVVFAGVEIPPNTAVLFGIAAANRDPQVFTDPDRFDISRNSRTLLTFGPGLRTCPGMHLAQKNLETALRIVAERFPSLRLDQASASLPEGILLRGTASLPVSWR